MNLPARYDSQATEKKCQQLWEEKGVYKFSRVSSRTLYAIDTPPPTVSGDLHLGHCYSYSQTDFIARFWRMNEYNVYYPMGWDDNGLPTERLVEKRLGIKPEQVGREKFVEAITETSRELEENYESLWRRLGLSVDWGYSYSTISRVARRISQYSFVDLYKKGLAYRASAPSIWCPLCGTAIAQAEVDDLERETNFVTIAFKLNTGEILPIATTRPELLSACVAVFVHPEDQRYQGIIGRTALTPLFDREVPIKADSKANPEKGTGIVMCCTFGDTTDVEWWRFHNLPLISVIERDGKLNKLAGTYAGLEVKTAREKIINDLANKNLLLDQKHVPQTVRVHERCDTPVEYIETKQWFIKVLENRERFLEAGRSITWHPPYMHARYENWVKNLGWDWCISRQRYYGVPFPVWYCVACGETALADPSELPIDPLVQRPSKPCECGSVEFMPDNDVMDTWATSSVSPQIAGRWLEDNGLFEMLFPMTLRPQAHEIIRTWAFYTIVKSLYHFNKLPWTEVAISGWGMLPEGGKVSKSRGGGPLEPKDMMDQYSADAVRYWAASTGLGRDTVISEEKISIGHKLVTKLWNVTSFSMRFLDGYQPPQITPKLAPTDRWILSVLQRVIQKVTDSFKNYEYTSALDEVESFFWNILADNYLEMVKVRLYELPNEDSKKESAKYTLHHVLLGVLKMLAPIMPYITEEAFQLHFVKHETSSSIHNSTWPMVSQEMIDESAESLGKSLVGIAVAVRRYKTTNQLRMGEPLNRLNITSPREELLTYLHESLLDIKSVTRAENIDFSDTPILQASAIDGIKDLWVTMEK